MPPSTPHCVFISYAHKDGAELAQRLHADLTKSFDTWLDKQRLTAGDIWSREVEDVIERADVILALLSTGSYESEICRAELSRGLQKGKCVVPLRAQIDCDVMLELQTRQWLDFSDPRLYDEQLPKLIEAIQQRSGIILPAGSLIRYNNAPSLPENFVNRPEILKRLRNTLFTEGANRNIALTAMQGMGGIGKTVLAQALCRDEVVQQAFPDGIFWFAIGKESQLDFPARIKSVPGLDRLLGRYDGEAACLAQYRDVVRKKAALIVVDDVWRASDVQPFIAESPRSRLLITTRDTSIGAWFGAREFTANLLTVGESRQVLAKWCGRPVAELPSQAPDVIHECGYLPLALAMIGAQLRGKPPVLWNSILNHLHRADLQKIKAQWPEPHTTLFRAIQISVDALDEPARQRYLAMAVLLEDMAAAPQVQQCIWGVDENEAAETAEQFVQLSLAQRDKSEGSIGLHDLQLDYVRERWPREDREALDLIRGALRLSSHVIIKDPGQFASQIVGRLVTYLGEPAINAFTKTAADGQRKPWLRSLYPALHPPGTGLLRTLSGHSNHVNAVVVTADGQRAVSASDDRTVKVWDLASGRELLTVNCDTPFLYKVAVTADSQRAITVSHDYTPKVWDLANGRELLTLSGHSDWVRSVAVTPDGQRAVSASDDRTLKVWDLASGRELHTLSGHSDSVYEVTVTPDGQRAVSGSSDKTLKVWDLASGRELCTLFGHSGPVWAVAVTPDGQRAVSGSSDKTLKVWDLASGREIRTLSGHGRSVISVAVTPDGRRAVLVSSEDFSASSEHHVVRVWDLASGRELRVLSGHTAPINEVAVTPDGQWAVSASDDGTLKVWDLTGRQEQRALLPHADWIRAVAATPDGQRVVSAFGDYTLKVWDLASGQELHTLSGHSLRINQVVVVSDGERAISASSDNTLKVWDLTNGRELLTLFGHSGPVTAVDVTPDGQRAVSGSSDKTLKVWDLASGREFRTLSGVSGSVDLVKVTADGLRVVSASGDEMLKVWDLASGRELNTLSGNFGFVYALAVLPDELRAVSVSDEQMLKVWDLASGRELSTLSGHSGPVTAVDVTPDGQRAVSASRDQTLKLWELETGACLATFTCDSAPLCSCITDESNLIVAGDLGGYLHFLRLEEPKPKA